MRGGDLQKPCDFTVQLAVLTYNRLLLSAQSSDRGRSIKSRRTSIRSMRRSMSRPVTTRSQHADCTPRTCKNLFYCLVQQAVHTLPLGSRSRSKSKSKSRTPVLRLDPIPRTAHVGPGLSWLSALHKAVQSQCTYVKSARQIYLILLPT